MTAKGQRNSKLGKIQTHAGSAGNVQKTDENLKGKMGRLKLGKQDWRDSRGDHEDWWEVREQKKSKNIGNPPNKQLGKPEKSGKEQRISPDLDPNLLNNKRSEKVFTVG